MTDPARRLPPGPFWSGPIEYALPPELIAQRPAARRQDARLMIVDRAHGEIRHSRFAEFPELIGGHDIVVANDSRVFPARIVGTKPTGGRVELLLLASGPAGGVAALAGSSKPLRVGQTVELAGGAARCVVSRVGRAGRCWLDFGSERVAELLEQHGHVPLPPYIERGKRALDDRLDRERYQTVFARDDAGRGSVAAPTAGLHLTDEAIAQIRARGAQFATVTLDVGPGTFSPIRADPADHAMQAERCSVGTGCARAINEARAAGGRRVAIGTTTVRTLETACDERGRVHAHDGDSDLFIRPGFAFRAVDALVTNFHLPHSTLLCLVLAFGGDELVREAYRVAVAERYRFYSYGDAMLVL